MDSIASHITSLTIVYSIVHSGADQRKHQSFASLAFVWDIHRWPVNFPRKWPVTRKMFPLDDVIMDFNHGFLTLKQQETQGCVVSTVATDVLVLKHQAISTHKLTKQFLCIEILYLWWTTLENEINK